ncbi:MAG: glucokinase [Pseudomonadota bacterium]
MRVLAGDIGGTHSRFLVAEVDGDRVEPLAEARVPSGDHPDLAPAVRAAFPDGVPGAPVRACFAVAGPVHAGTARITNLPWTLEEGRLASELGLERVTLINDFVGVGEGLPALGPGQYATLQAGERDPGGTIGYLGPGTGLGQGALVPCGDGHAVVPSEGGHAGLAPRTEREVALVAWWRERLGRVCREDLLSGPGLARIAAFLREGDGIAPGPEVAAALADGNEDPAALLGRAGLAGEDPLAMATVATFAELLGAIAGDWGLETAATGGLFLAGGIPPRLLPALREPAFLEAFNDKGPMTPLATRLPVHVVTEPRVGLLGAARRAAGQ